MAKKGKASSKPATPVVEEPKGKGKKGKKKEQDEDTAANKNKQQQNRAKVTSTTNWTGKLPHTLLHELCQKRKWNKVEYDMKKIGDKGMLAIAVLSWTDPKSKEVISIRMNDPTYDKVSGKGLYIPQETPMEARHIAATIALYRIAYNTNMQMMLPPNHKNLWYDLSDFKKSLNGTDPKKCDKIFDVDPFKTFVEDRKQKEQQDKERNARFQQAEKEQKKSVILSTNSNKKEKSPIHKKERLENKSNDSLVSFPRKVWDNATFIDLSESARQIIESNLKLHIDWKSKVHKPNEKSKSEIREALRSKLIEFNFREPHVDEAMNYKDPLSFLLVNLPEDDLPPFFHKRKEDSNNVVEISTLPLSTRNMVERLTESGISKDEALYALGKSQMNEPEAAGLITQNILPSLVTDEGARVSEDESHSIWKDELDSLQSIYSENITVLDANSCYTMTIIEKFNLKLKVYKTKHYPSTLPGIIVSTFDKSLTLPNYIKHQILSKLLNYIDEYKLLNDMMIYTIFEWLQENISKIIDNPGPLLSEDEFRNSRGITSVIDQSKSNSYNRKNKSNNGVNLTAGEIEDLNKKYAKRIKSDEYNMMLINRKNLPAWKIQRNIVDLVFSNDVVLITGETGSGKSTQVVQFLLDHLINTHNDYNKTKIICTQPRRISAIGLADRVADERCVKVGDEVGYVIRGVNKTNENTRIRFMTTGVLVRILQSDKSFLNNSIVVIDEVHERSIDTDLIIILLNNLIGKIPGLKIVLMSATVDIKVFSTYFKNLKTCHIEGRTFPIVDYFLDDILPAVDFKIKNNMLRYDSFEDEDIDSQDEFIRPGPNSRFFKSGQINYDLITDVVDHIDRELSANSNDGSIIVFLPGISEINKSCKMLSKSKFADLYVILPLHSALTPEDQKRVFLKYKGKRKIVVSTNIAETSITIDDCVAVVDTGRAKTSYYSSTDNTTRLIESFISKAEAKQRRGRSGRVREGICYRLFSKETFEDSMVAAPAPEIRRVSLESLYLSVKAMGIKNVKAFLKTGLDPPPLKSLEKAERMLTTVGLLNNEDGSLSQLGQFISLMPVIDCKHGKLLIYSIIFGCTDIGILIASLLGANSMPFIGGAENRDEIKRILAKRDDIGDLLSMVYILEQYYALCDSTSKRSFMKENMLSYNKIKEISSNRTQLYSILKDVGFLPMDYQCGSSEYLNRNRNNIDILKCILTGAFYPHIARVQLPDAKFAATSVGAIQKDPEANLIKFWIRNEEYIDNLQNLKKEMTNKEITREEINALPLPLTRAFIHPSSVLFSKRPVNQEDMISLNEIDQPLNTQINAPKISKSPFIIYNSSQQTTKLYLKDITPVSTLSLLLFGGPISYDVNNRNYSPGVVVDEWLPIRTWCKNGVLINELRSLLDESIKCKLDIPNYSRKSMSISKDKSFNEKADEILQIVEHLITVG
ncbi:hypothetical protein Kpol_1055p50 [Vanderwaltozyma polyspora DSM 70294]|uniref:RNA helicase n=1 Tax=Vanderwaltozyma polyspora (strain ATCC 22028 / DSM 70294 / BCRC 21397 / CBS 2163 / NBRC 10782 / NRRL Y-8283 / UCD 57-17) TaxID=436907 RepID=A7TGC4_VANPO|nr:uncharacterized protein Kpol_1055p50 [Vanderwaltozyma polyspora DSM 70294]EDO18694.1 hypothetical protein Kpol_1055p50 [Vanderwaltozyma polyspora DSM 70294]